MDFLSETYTDIRQFLLSAARWAWGLPDPLTIEFLPRTYDENGVQPRKRWIKLILRSSRSTWHLKLTFQGTITDDRHPIFGKKPKRRKDLQDLCHCIDFHRVQLLDDTVTEVILALDPVKESVRLPYEKRPGRDNEFFSVIDQLWVYTREDPDRVRFPTFNSNRSIPTRELSDIRSKEELDGHSVYKVLLHSDETPYIYKEIERPHYIPADTEVLEQELYNLELFRGNTFGIVQLIAAVVSQNPYQTTPSTKKKSPGVLYGVLLEYHPNGTLEDALKMREPQINGRWCQWAVQIASALFEMHRRGITHMDLKPANVVITANFDAVLIDVSGIGGVTREWLSPEMRGNENPFSKSIEERKQNDIWALGRIMMAMADAYACSDDEKQKLRSVAQAATRSPPRIPLGHVIAALSERPSTP